MQLVAPVEDQALSVAFFAQTRVDDPENPAAQAG